MKLLVASCLHWRITAVWDVRERLAGDFPDARCELGSLRERRDRHARRRRHLGPRAVCELQAKATSTSRNREAMTRGEAQRVGVVLEGERQQLRTPELAGMLRHLPVQQPTDAAMPRLGQNKQHRHRNAARFHPHRHPGRSDPHRLTIEHPEPVPATRRPSPLMLDRLRLEDQPTKNLGHDPRLASRIRPTVNKLNRHRGRPRLRPTFTTGQGPAPLDCASVALCTPTRVARLSGAGMLGT